MIKREFLYLIWYLLLCVPIIILYVKFSIKAKREWLTLTGQIKPQRIPGKEERKYIRLESILPVEFQKVEGKSEFDIHQGFTKDVGRDGMCIETLTIHGKNVEDLTPNTTKLKLIINVPSEIKPTIVLATVRWIRKIENAFADRFLIGVSYDDISEPGLSKIIKHLLWFRRKSDIFAFVIVGALVIAVAFVSAVFIFRDTRLRLEQKISMLDQKNLRLTKQTEVLRREKEEIVKDLESVAQEYTLLQKTLKGYKKEKREKREAIPKAPAREERLIVEEDIIETEEAAAEEGEETLEPIVELREPIAPEDEILFEPNITRKMVESEKEIYNTFRDYILEEDVQLLDRYSSLHKTSIYHAAGLFALAELRYKNGYIKEMTMKAYSDVIKMYPRSKYASYASHRLDQLKRHLPYSSYSLKYYHTEYNLPALFDYRELEPYKK